jgi:hypothetical protein
LELFPMCGIAGLIAANGPATRELVRAMTDRIVPRGPDSSDEWISDDGRVGLGHRRLAIIDLSAAGAQPMHSHCGRYTVTYNGEIYNFEELRGELAAAGLAPAWRGHSDTEVMLAAFSAWGLRKGIEKLSGMFALAVWDHRDRTLTLARDRFGEKPLYYGWVPAGFAFASTLGPIAATPGFANPVDPQALAGLMARAYVPAPLSIHRGIFKLPPGCLLTVPADIAERPSEVPHPAVERWFDYADQVLAGAADPISDQTEALDALDAAPAGRGCPGRQLPLGRDRLLAGHRDCAKVRQSADQDLHHRLQRSRFRRSGVCEKGRRGARDRAHRTLRERAGRARRDPEIADYVRRAIRGFVADSHASRFPAGPQSGDGFIVWRCG